MSPLSVCLFRHFDAPQGMQQCSCIREAPFLVCFATLIGEKSYGGFFLPLVKYCLNKHKEQNCQVVMLMFLCNL